MRLAIKKLITVSKGVSNAKLTLCLCHCLAEVSFTVTVNTDNGVRSLSFRDLDAFMYTLKEFNDQHQVVF